MNATCKRLLSWLVVVTMVLSMVPVLDLSNFAVTTQAVIDEDNQAKIDAAATVIAAAKNLGAFAAPESGATTITKDCPVCGPDQEWTALSGTGLAAEVFTKADSKITHHHYYLSDNATFSGSAMTTGGGNNHYVCLNLNGKTLTTGAVAITTNFGNIFNIMDTVGTGVLAGKSAGASAAAINVQNPNAKVNIYGGTIKRATGSNAYSSVMYIQGLGGQINLYAGTVDGTGINNTSYATVATLTANDGRTGTFNVYGGEVKCGTTTGDGNIQVKANAVFNVYGGTVKDGVARGGGNFNVNGTGVLNVHGGTISGGQANKSTNITVSGGNIILTSGGTLNMDGGVICGGTTTAHGGNIQIRRDQVGHIDITGGKIYGGTAGNGNGHNIYAYSTTTGSTLSIGGTAEIAGDIYAGTGVTTTLSGTPKIKTSGLYAADDTTAVTAKNGGLTVGATIAASGVTGGEIQVTAALNKVLTDTFETAATVAQYFSNTDATLDVGVNDANQLVVIEYVEPEEPVDEPQVGVFAPESCGGMAYCDACIDAGMSEEDALVEWTPISGTGLAAINSVGAGNTGRNHYHYYLSDDASFSASAFTFTTNGATTCVHLNGKDLTAGNRAIVLNFGSTINIMDTTGGSITGKYTGQNGAAIYVANPAGIVNIYGGTFKKTSDSHASASVVWTQGYGGTINMYGGTIDATGVSGINAQPGVVLKADEGRKATFNMYGGNIIGAATTGDGGAVYLTARTTFNLHNGTISGGSGRAGGNIMVYTGTLNIHGGTISGGKSTLSTSTAYVTGGNIAVRDGGVLTMDGGVVCNGEASVNGGNIALWTSVNTVTITGGKIYGGVAGTSGANIFSNGKADSALTIGGTAEIAGDIATNHTTTNTLSGSPKILTSGLTDAEGNPVTGTKGYEVKGNTNIVIDQLTANAQIEVTGEAGVAFTAACDNAATVAAYFTSTVVKTKIVITDENKLQIVSAVETPVVGVFNPAACDGMAYCDACMEAGIAQEDALVEWTAISGTDLAAKSHNSGTNQVAAHFHYYLSDNATFTGSAITFGGNNNIVCLHLNGKTMTTGDRAIVVSHGSTVNVMDHAQNAGAIVGTCSGLNGAAIYVANPSGKVNIYGGTLKKASTSHIYSSVIWMQGYGGVINMYNGIIDATGVEGATQQPGIVMKADDTRTATFNMFDGEIIGGTTTGDGGAVMLYANATFNLYDGIIRDGVARAGGNVAVNGGTFNMEGGTISGGESTNDNANVAGGNVFVRGGGTFHMEGGEVCYGTSVQCGGNIQVYTSEVGIIEISGGQIYGGIAGVNGSAIKNTGAEGSVLDITGGTISGDIFTGEAVELGFAGLTKDTVVVMSGDATLNLAEGQELCVDNRGCTITVTGNGTLYATDSANDDYNGYGTWIVDETVTVINDVINPVNGNRYIVIKNEADANAWSAHRITMKLTAASLRAKEDLLYYKAVCMCDGTLAERINEGGSYGIVFSLEDMPDQESFMGVNSDQYSVMAADFVPGEVSTSTKVVNILKPGADNNERSNMKLYATPYIYLDTDLNGTVDNDHFVGYVDDATYLANSGISQTDKSLLGIIKNLDAKWNEEGYLTPAQKQDVLDFYARWEAEGLDWSEELTNIA